MDLLIEMLSILLLGIIGGAIPGAILTSVFTEVLRKGFIRSLTVILFAGISEIIVASFILIFLFSTHIPPAVFYIVSFIGAGVLVWIARQIWSIKKFQDSGKIFSFKKIFLLTVFNGPLWIFWSTICVPQAYVLSQKIRGGQGIFLLLFELGWFGATLALTFIFSRFRPILVKEGSIAKVFKIFALFLLIFALRLVITSTAYFLHGF